MNNHSFVRLIFCLVLIIPGCSKDKTASEESIFDEPASVSMLSKGAQQVSGVGFLAETAECDYQSQGAAYAVKMTT